MKSGLPDYDAAAYERYRPSYPTEVAKTIFSLTRHELSNPILEIGCGTGKGTEIFIKQGATVHAVEPNRKMGAVAEERFPRESFSWTPTTFEEYRDTRKYHVVTSAHAFQWVDQEVALDKIYDLLEPGGSLAIFRNSRKVDDDFSRAETELSNKLNGSKGRVGWNEQYYAALAETITEFREQSKGRFALPQVYEFNHSIEYTSEKYIGLQRTYWSDALEQKGWDTFLRDLSKTIESLGGTIFYHYTTVLYLLFKIG